MKISRAAIGLVLGIASGATCSAQDKYQKPDIEAISIDRASALDAAFVEIVKKHKINTLGAAVVKNKNVVWQGQFGLQSPSVPANPNTLFDIASITKTITAETILRLVAKGKLSLDEPIAPYWIDPDLENSSEVQQLTARMLLNHTSGFMNWRYFAQDKKLSFEHSPGTEFRYSGEGFEYLARYAESKTGVPFEQLVESTIFEPLGMDNSHLVVDEENYSHMARPLDIDGTFYGYYCQPWGYCNQQGSYSAAANMVTTVADYAKFLISAMSGEGLSASLRHDRNSMQGVQFTQDEIDCDDLDKRHCPTQLGYGLGWSISHFNDGKLIGHRGTSWSVVSLTYYYQDSGDGLIIFFNAPNKYGIAGMIDALTLLDPDSPELPGYRLRLARKD